MRLLTPKGRDAQEARGCCGEMGQVAIPCELAEPHSQLSHQNPCRRISGKEGFEGKWSAHMIRLRKGLPTGLPLAQSKPSPHKPYPIPLETATKHGLSLHELLAPVLNLTLPPLGKGPTYG